jgi:hypothetical protein
MNACLKVWDVFKICCNHVCVSHSWLSLKKWNKMVYNIEWRFMRYIVDLQRSNLVVLKKL